MGDETLFDGEELCQWILVIIWDLGALWVLLMVDIELHESGY